MPGLDWTGWFVVIVDQHGHKVDEVPITLSPNRLPAAPDASIGRRAVEVEVPNHILAVAPVELLIRLE
jgi:hypothetical protein